MTGARRAWRAEYLAELPSQGVEVGFARIEGPGLNTSLLLRIGHDGKGEIICTGIVMGLLEASPARVTATALRLPLQEILAAIGRQIGWSHFVTGGWLPLSPGVHVKPSAKGYTDDELRDLVREYRKARKENPRAPTKTLAEKRHLSDQAIRYQLRLAEKRKLLKRRVRTRTKARARGGQR